MTAQEEVREYIGAVNLVLFEPHELAAPLALDDARARHVLDVLRRRPGDSFDCGVVNGARGKAFLRSVGEAGLLLGFDWGDAPPALAPVTLIIGLPRPQTARKLLEEATALGVEAMHFVRTERGDPGYAASRLWSSGEWRRHLVAGAQQAFSTRLPRISYDATLEATLTELPASYCRVALDNYETTRRLSGATLHAPCVLAVGPERGWSPRERDLLRGSGFQLLEMGERVLRVETATVAALAIVLAKLGDM